MAGHYPGILMSGQKGTNAPKFVPPHWGRPRFDPTQKGCANSVVGLELADLSKSKKLKSVSVTAILTVIESEKIKSATAIPQLIVRKDFWNYEVGIGNP